MKHLKQILEGLLKGQDATMQAGDEFAELYSVAQNDWEKLISSKRFKKYSDSRYKLHIQSSALAKYLCNDISGINLSDAEFVEVIFDMADFLWAGPKYFDMTVASKNSVKVISCKIEYATADIVFDEIIIKNAQRIIVDAIMANKQLHDVDYIKTEFINKIKYKTNR
jgi:hypothetical protein